MELLIGTVLAGLIEIIKVISEKFGTKITTAVVYIILFVIALGWSFLQSRGLITAEMIADWMKIVAGAIAIYELLIKRVAQPLIKY